MAYIADTIAAISTALGEGAIGIVRLSGDNAIEIADSVFKGKNLQEVKSHTINYGHIINPVDNSVIDEVMVSVMKAPKTYTKEDIVEINCHGGVVALKSVLEIILENGARLAEAGEFTKRAFLNGRIDLSQAEAVMDVIQAKTDQAMSVSMKQLQGGLSNKITSLRDKMLETLATVEVTIDYPEYDDVEELSTSQLKETSLAVKAEIESILKQAQSGKIFRQGLKTAIVGRPNVGKSSLLNALVGEEKAIVTDIAGTTRDIIEEYINVGGVPLKLIDTAGIRETDELVEQIGVEKSKQVIEEADLIILVINQADELNEIDISLLEDTVKKEHFILLNKRDLEPKVKLSDLTKWTSEDNIIQTVITEDKGLSALKDSIVERFLSGSFEQGDLNYLLNTRHTNLLKQAIEALDNCLEGIDIRMPVDLIQIDFTQAWDLLGEITGETVQDELLDKLFSQFCLGK